jgi:hypothetical protein
MSASSIRLNRGGGVHEVSDGTCDWWRRGWVSSSVAPFTGCCCDGRGGGLLRSTAEPASSADKKGPWLSTIIGMSSDLCSRMEKLSSSELGIGENLKMVICSSIQGLCSLQRNLLTSIGTRLELLVVSSRRSCSLCNPPSAMIHRESPP